MDQKFTVVFEKDGKKVVVEMDSTPANVNGVAFESLLKRLLRLKPGDQLSIPHSELEAVSPEDLDRVCAIADAAVQCGCSATMDDVIENDPEVRGVTFTRVDIVPPVMDYVKPEGSA